jgi:hypothetical protein
VRKWNTTEALLTFLNVFGVLTHLKGSNKESGIQVIHLYDTLNWLSALSVSCVMLVLVTGKAQVMP